VGVFLSKFGTCETFILMDYKGAGLSQECAPSVLTWNSARTELHAVKLRCHVAVKCTFVRLKKWTGIAQLV
jgi:hypothetical protein